MLPTKADGSAKVSVYHSELVNATAAGPIWIMLKGTPRDSTFQGKPPFISFQANGEQADRKYQIENDGIKAFLEKLPLNEWLAVTATGTRDNAVFAAKSQAQDFGFSDAPPAKAPASSPPPPPAPGAAPPPPPSMNGKGAAPSAPPAAAPAIESPPPAPAPVRAPLAAEWLECFHGACFVKGQALALAKNEIESQAAADLDPQSLATSLFIEYQRSYGNRTVYPHTSVASVPTQPVNRVEAAVGATPPNPGKPWSADDDDLPF